MVYIGPVFASNYALYCSFCQARVPLSNPDPHRHGLLATGPESAVSFQLLFNSAVIGSRCIPCSGAGTMLNLPVSTFSDI